MFQEAFDSSQISRHLVIVNKSEKNWFVDDETNVILNVIKIKDQYKLNHDDETIFVTNRKNFHHESAKYEFKVCLIQHEKQKPLVGLNFVDFEYIENYLFHVGPQNLKSMEDKRCLKTLDIVLCPNFPPQMFTESMLSNLLLI